MRGRRGTGGALAWHRSIGGEAPAAGHGWWGMGGGPLGGDTQMSMSMSGVRACARAHGGLAGARSERTMRLYMRAPMTSWTPTLRRAAIAGASCSEIASWAGPSSSVLRLLRCFHSSSSLKWVMFHKRVIPPRERSRSVPSSVKPRHGTSIVTAAPPTRERETSADHAPRGGGACAHWMHPLGVRGAQAAAHHARLPHVQALRGSSSSEAVRHPETPTGWACP